MTSCRAPGCRQATERTSRKAEWKAWPWRAFALGTGFCRPGVLQVSGAAAGAAAAAAQLWREEEEEEADG